MGTTTSSRFSDKLALKYDFIQYIDNPTEGGMKIYRKKQPFYDYVMVIEKLVGNEEVQNYEAQLQQIDKLQKGQQQSTLLKIYAYQLIPNNIQCSTKSRLRLSVQYYNYSLKSLIQYKTQHQLKFLLEQINYVLWNLLSVYRFYYKIDAINVEFHSEEILITPDGEIRFNPLSIFPKYSYNQTDCTQTIDCLPIKKFKKTYKMKDKLILYEIKKILAEMTLNCNPTQLEDRQIFALKRHINACTTIPQLTKLLYRPTVDRLDFTPKKHPQIKSQQQTTTTKICKNSLAGSESKYSQQSKISVKNYVREIRKQHRPYSYQHKYLQKNN